MVYDFLHSSEQREHTIAEAVRRISIAFSRVVIDRHRGLKCRAMWGENCGSSARWKDECNGIFNPDPDAVWVCISDLQDRSDRLVFVLENERDFFISHRYEFIRKNKKHLVMKLASALNYEACEWWYFFDVSVDLSLFLNDSEIQIYQEIAICNQLRGELADRNCEADDIKFHVDSLTLAVATKRCRQGRRMIAEAIHSVFPGACYRIHLPAESKPRSC